jgi:hypothetical protein
MSRGGGGMEIMDMPGQTTIEIIEKNKRKQGKEGEETKSEGGRLFFFGGWWGMMRLISLGKYFLLERE